MPSIPRAPPADWEILFGPARRPALRAPAHHSLLSSGTGPGSNPVFVAKFRAAGRSPSLAFGPHEIANPSLSIGFPGLAGSWPVPVGATNGLARAEDREASEVNTRRTQSPAFRFAPAFDPQAPDPFEVSSVVRNERPVVRQGVRGHGQVQIIEARTLTLERSLDVAKGAADGVRPDHTLQAGKEPRLPLDRMRHGSEGPSGGTHMESPCRSRRSVVAEPRVSARSWLSSTPHLRSRSFEARCGRLGRPCSNRILCRPAGTWRAPIPLRGG